MNPQNVYHSNINPNEDGELNQHHFKVYIENTQTSSTNYNDENSSTLMNTTNRGEENANINTNQNRQHFLGNKIQTQPPP